jgi:hypothetical protein
MVMLIKGVPRISPGLKLALRVVTTLPGIESTRDVVLLTFANEGEHNSSRARMKRILLKPKNLTLLDDCIAIENLHCYQYLRKSLVFQALPDKKGNNLRNR